MFFLVCDGLKGLPEVAANTWPQTIVQTCVVHLIRSTFRLVARQDWDAVKRDIKPIYTAPNPAPLSSLSMNSRRNGGRNTPRWFDSSATPGENSSPFLDYDIEIWRMICSTNALEYLNARY